MLKKQLLKSKPVCKVTFILPEAIQAENAAVIGDFNGWNRNATPMTALKSGGFKVTVDLEAGQRYEFRYVVNGSETHNDWQADAYVPNPYGSDNSVVLT